MKSLYAFILTILFSFGLSLQGTAQTCNSYINVSLANTGTAKIYAESVLEGNTADYTNLSWEFLSFDCSDIGENDYSISGLYQGSAFSCGGIIKIEDKLGPIAICNKGVVVSVVNTDTVWLTPDLVSDTSYDNCSAITSTIFPDFVTTDDIGNFVTTVITVADAEGNENSCWAQIYVQGDPSNQSLACNDQVEVYVTATDEVQLEAEDLIEGSYSNPVSLAITDANQDTVPDNIITADYLGLTLTYIVTDLTNGNSCWGTLLVSEPSTMEMTCNDEVNLTLAVGDSFEVSANELLQRGNPVGTEVQLYSNGEEVENNMLTPELIGQAITYTVFDENGNSICGGDITLTECGSDYDPFVVCDTKSRAALINDCIWEHTSTDNVEWPADFTLTISAVLTEDNLDQYTSISALQDNGMIDMRDVEPRFVGGCFALSINFVDQPIPTDNGFKVIRTWTVLDWNDSNTYTYTQIIKLDGLASNLDDLDASLIAIKGNPVNQSIQFVDAIDQALNYQIVSLTGRQVMSGQIQNNIDVSSLAEGYYFLRVVNESQAQVIKFEILR